MKYNIKAHPTKYGGVLFRSRLEARWAAFFDLAGWRWEYEPIDIRGWTPDFKVTFSCGHSECSKFHTLLVEVKPYSSISEFSGHPCMDYPFGGHGEKNIPADASAAFGINPDTTYWEMAHGAGGGCDSVGFWVRDANDLWLRAGARVQYNPKN